MSRKTKYDIYGDDFKTITVALGELPRAKQVLLNTRYSLRNALPLKEKKTTDITMTKQDKGTFEAEEKRELKRLCILEWVVSIFTVRRTR